LVTFKLAFHNLRRDEIRLEAEKAVKKPGEIQFEIINTILKFMIANRLSCHCPFARRKKKEQWREQR
jgi:hypothetical protein